MDNANKAKWSVVIAKFMDAHPTGVFAGIGDVTKEDVETAELHVVEIGTGEDARICKFYDKITGNSPYEPHEVLPYATDWNELMRVYEKLLDTFGRNRTAGVDIRIFDKWAFYRSQIEFGLLKPAREAAFIACYQACQLYMDVQDRIANVDVEVK